MRTRSIAIIAGCTLILVSIIARMTLAWITPAPGKLVPKQAQIVWHSREPKVAGEPAATFEVKNVGGTPVRILSVESGCGCATPEVRPRVVAPGARAVVEVQATPSETGERPVAILLRTDAPASPRVLLELRILGSRRPPCLVSVEADLTYREGYTTEESREVFVVTLDSINSRVAPTPRSDLPFLRFGPPRVKSRPLADSPTVLHRTFTFPVKFAGTPPDGSVFGRVTVADPWEAGRVLGVNVQLAANPPARAIPARLILTLAGPDDRDAHARFLVRTRDAAPDLRVEAEAVGAAPLLVSRVSAAGPPAFDVRWKSGLPVAEGEHHLIVHVGSTDLTVPVLVKKGEGR